MCRLCAVKDLAARNRWPKPLEPLKADIKFLVESAHDEYLKYKSNKHTAEETPTSAPILELLRLLVTLLDKVEEEREKWWTSPNKREQRKRLEANCEQRKLSDLHVINNAVIDSIEAMNARLGTFVKWTMDVKGGVEELQNGPEVVKDGEEKKAVDTADHSKDEKVVKDTKEKNGGRQDSKDLQKLVADLALSG